MSDEPSTKVPSSSSPPRPSPSSSSASSSPDSYVGSFISLTSKYEIRYEGVLYYLNPQDSTLGLKNVRSYGTEGRKKDGPQIPPSDKVYEYIMFRGSDIKDLQVKSSPPAQKEELIQNDPAIIQSQSWLGPSSASRSASVSGGSLTQISSYQEPSALSNPAYSGTMLSYQSGTPMGPGGPMQANQNPNVSSLAMPTYWPGYNGSTFNIPFASQHHNHLLPASATTTPLPVAMQNLLQPSATSAPISGGLTYSSDVVAPVPSHNAYNSVNFNTTSAVSSEQHPASSSIPSFLSVQTSLPSHPALLTANRLAMSTFPSYCKDINATEAPFVGKAGSDLVPALSVLSLQCSASSVADSPLGPALLTPNQLAQPSPPMLYSTHNPYPDQKDILALNSVPPNLSSSYTNPAVQAPLLPLPHSAQPHSMPQFTEEFDFEAMNEKFRKDEVWGYLGRVKQRDTAEGTEDSAVGQSKGHEGGYGSEQRLNPNPAYNKDEFFDTISCNSLPQGPRNGQNRFSERMKLDSQTFGNFHQRPHGGYGAGRGENFGNFHQRPHGGYGAGRGENYRGSYNNWERGYNYGGRGRGGVWRI